MKNYIKLADTHFLSPDDEYFVAVYDANLYNDISVAQAAGAVRFQEDVLQGQVEVEAFVAGVRSAERCLGNVNFEIVYCSPVWSN